MMRVPTSWMAVAAFVVVEVVGSASAKGPVSLYIDPACPTPNESISLYATVGSGRSSLVWEPTEAVVENDVVRFVVSRIDEDEDAPVVYSRHSVVATLGPLPAGSYRVQLFVRAAARDEPWGPALLQAFADLMVQDNPPPCAARHIVGKVSQMLVATVGQPYSTPFVVEVTDAHGRPAPNPRIVLSRFGPFGVGTSSRRADIVLAGATSIVTPGTYAFAARANDVPGTFQYSACLVDLPFDACAFFVVSNRAGPDPWPLVPVVVYSGFGQQDFLTSSFEEMAKLDRSVGWFRTGDVFLAYDAGTGARPDNARPVCRFYGRAEAGLDSHFFSASTQECEDLKGRSSAWLLESDDAFGVFLPDTRTGTCPAGTQAIHRAYTNRPDAAHRYATDPSRLDVTEYPTGPWIREGFGPEGVVMCAPR